MVAALALSGCTGSGGSKGDPDQPVQETTAIPPASTPAPSTPAGSSSPANSSAPSALPAAVDSPLGPATPAAFSEMLRPGGLRTRWLKSQVSVSFETTPTDSDLYVFEESAKKLASLAPGLSLVRTTSAADIEIHYLPKSRWAEIGMDSPDMGEVSGYTQTTFDKETILSAVIVIDSDLGQLGRNRTLVHELVHSLGLGHNTCQGSLMYGQSGYDPNWVMSRYDETIFSAWYSTDPGATLESLPCPPVQWDSVNVVDSGADQTIWCSRSSSECFAVSPFGGLDPSATPAWWRTEGGLSRSDPSKYVQLNFKSVLLVCELPRPLSPYGACTTQADQRSAPYWYDGSVIYTYDPTMFKAFSVDGRRLLCELPSPGTPYARCQFTDGSSVTVAEMYTDGATVYKNPPGS